MRTFFVHVYAKIVLNFNVQSRDEKLFMREQPQWNENNPIECQKHTKNAENQNPLLIALITGK